MNESEIRSRDALRRYLEMVSQDVARYFHDTAAFTAVPCPACGRGDQAFEFEKIGFRYVTCSHCQTLFANPRPPIADLKHFYTEAASTQFWINEFFQPVAEVRREKIFRPRAQDIARRFGADRKWRVGDIGAGFGLFLAELRRLWPHSDLLAIEPSSQQADICRAANFKVFQGMVEEMTGYEGGFDLLTSFELLEHLQDPGIFLAQVWDLLQPGGCLYLTTLNGLGFDIQILWEHSKAIFPPHHLNFFNPDSVGLLLERHGYAIQEIATPGRLDWDIVEGMYLHDHFEVGRFWKLLAAKGTPEAKQQLQEWISRHKFSSHMRIVAQKKL
jgi:SAM-dependent methyltransferase